MMHPQWEKIDEYVDDHGYRIIIFRRVYEDGFEQAKALVIPPKE